MHHDETQKIITYVALNLTGTSQLSRTRVLTGLDAWISDVSIIAWVLLEILLQHALALG